MLERQQVAGCSNRRPHDIWRAQGRQRLVLNCAFRVRPYTVREGDSLASIARKRNVDIKELVTLNHDVANPEELLEGQTIVLPAGRLSKRDKDILGGMGQRAFRTYPVRSGESIEEIIDKRGISRPEVDALNPGTDLNHLTENQLIKLPANKFTVREREMLTGTLGVPTEFFAPGSTFANSLIVALMVGGAYSFWLWKQRASSFRRPFRPPSKAPKEAPPSIAKQSAAANNASSKKARERGKEQASRSGDHESVVGPATPAAQIGAAADTARDGGTPPTDVLRPKPSAGPGAGESGTAIEGAGKKEQKILPTDLKGASLPGMGEEEDCPF